MRKEPIIALFLLVFLTGCYGSGGGWSGIVNYNARTGGTGLTADYIVNAPPDEIYSNTKFKLGLRVGNRGAEDVTDGLISFTYLEKYFTFHRQLPIHVSLEGKSFFNRDGDTENIFIDVTSGDVDYDMSLPITATMCYSYKTVMEDTVCIDPDIYNEQKRRKACAVHELALSDQGAPVAVRGVGETIVEIDKKRTAQFFISVENLDSGIVVDASPSQICSPNIPKEKLNRLRVNAYLGNTQMDCDPYMEGNDANEAVVHLEDNRGTVTCEVAFNADTEYTEPIKVILEYGYMKVLPQKYITITMRPGQQKTTSVPSARRR